MTDNLLPHTKLWANMTKYENPSWITLLKVRTKIKILIMQGVLVQYHFRFPFLLDKSVNSKLILKWDLKKYHIKNIASLQSEIKNSFFKKLKNGKLPYRFSSNT